MELAIIQRIHEIRGVKVMLDFDLAEQYGIETKRLKEAVRRNVRRFKGNDFMFELSKDEWCSLRSQIASSKRGGIRYLPFAFTELGVAMLSSVLNSEKAIDTNRNIMRAFVALRQYVLNYAELKHELDDFIRESNSKFDQNEMKFDALFNLFDEYIAYKKELEKPRNPIGFNVNRD
ncbi:MAG: ORF6N domain-containing protein [Bacteroidales bacterium]|nr:ORF6N domain-containing protein [Bacteroidales bacterium]